MKLYHIIPEAEAILRDGFKDEEGIYRNDPPGTDVLLRDSPPGDKKSRGNKVLRGDIPEEVVTPYERHFKEEKAYREFLVPAKIVNQYE